MFVFCQFFLYFTFLQISTVTYTGRTVLVYICLPVWQTGESPFHSNETCPLWVGLVVNIQKCFCMACNVFCSKYVWSRCTILFMKCHIFMSLSNAKNKEKPCLYFFILRRQDSANSNSINEIKSNASVNTLTQALLKCLQNVSVIFNKLISSGYFYYFFLPWPSWHIKSTPIPAWVWLCSHSKPLGCQSGSTFIKANQNAKDAFMHHHIGQ